MSEARQHDHDAPLSSEDADLWRSYEAAMEARRRGDLPGFTSEEEFLQYAATRS